MRRLRIAAVALTCGVLMSACGGGADPGFHPAGPVAASAEGSAEAVRTPGVETIIVAPELRVEVEWPSGLEPRQIAMLRAFGDNYVGQWRAVTSGGSDDSYLSGVEDEAGRDAYTWVRSFLRVKRSAEGVDKLYSLRVASVSGRGAEVDACVDESGLRVVDRSGDPLTEQPMWTKPPKAVYFQAAGLRRGGDSQWRITLFRHAAYPDERAKECVR